MNTLTVICIAAWAFMAGYFIAEKSLHKKLASDQEMHNYKLRQCLNQLVNK